MPKTLKINSKLCFLWELDIFETFSKNYVKIGNVLIRALGIRECLRGAKTTVRLRAKAP